MISKLDNFESFKQCIIDLGEMIIKRDKADCVWYDSFLKASEEKFGKKIYSYLEKTSDQNVIAFYDAYTKSKSEENSGINLKIMTLDNYNKVANLEETTKKKKK